MRILSLRVKEEEWYRKTIENTVYVFLNEATDEICIARKITNSYYIGPYDSNGTAVMVVSVARDQIENVFSSTPVTEGSGYAVLNEEGLILYRSDSPIEADIYDKAWETSGYGKMDEFTMDDSGKIYLVNYSKEKHRMQKLLKYLDHSDPLLRQDQCKHIRRHLQYPYHKFLLAEAQPGVLIASAFLSCECERMYYRQRFGT